MSSIVLNFPIGRDDKKELLEEMKGFDENFVVCEDYDLWLKITSQYEVGYIKEPLITKYGGHDDQLSKNLRPWIILG